VAITLQFADSLTPTAPDSRNKGVQPSAARPEGAGASPVLPLWKAPPMLPSTKRRGATSKVQVTPE
jgi:hypothetical protein